MIRRALVLGLGSIGLIVGAPGANASISQQCPYDVADWDVDQSLIDELCKEWERSKPKDGSKYKVKTKGKPGPCATGRTCHNF